MIKILKDGRWAIPGRPADPQISVKEGEERDDLPAALVASMIDAGHAEEPKPKKEPKPKTKAEPKPKSSAKPKTQPKGNAGEETKVNAPEETKNKDKE